MADRRGDSSTDCAAHPPGIIGHDRGIRQRAGTERGTDGARGDANAYANPHDADSDFD
jgi:hypothetical protein